MLYIQQKILLLVFVLTSLFATSQEINFTAELSRKNIGINERLSIDFTMNQNGDNFSPPTFTDFEVIMGPSQSVSHSWVNGKKSYSKTYTFVLAPLKQGKLTIGSASVVFQGKEYQTTPVQVEVTQAVDKPQKQTHSQGSANTFPFGFDPFSPFDQEETLPIESTQITEKELFIVADISKNTPYLNEPISIVYKVFINEKLGVRGLQISNTPKYNNFWRQEIPMQEYEIEKIQHQGETFHQITIKKVVLYPQKSQNITIEPLQVNVSLQVPTNKVDFFGRRFYDTQQKELSSGKINIKVKDLPEEGKPTDFSGAVGNFELATSLSKNNLQAGESTTAKIFISGKGNFKLFQAPKLNFPSALEVYDAEEKDNTKLSLSGVYGDVSYLYPIVVQQKGKYPIPAISFSYFNPETKSYVTKKSYDLLLEVQTTKQEANIAQNDDNPSIKNNTFHFIKQSSNWQKIGAKPFFGSWLFFSLLILPLLLLPLIIWLFRKYKLYSVISKENNTSKLSKKYLSSAKEHIANKNRFYDDLEKCLLTYLKAKLRLKTTELSKENISNLLAEKNIKQSDIQDFIKLICICEEARYAPYTTENPQADFNKAEQVITALDNQLK